MGASVLRSRWEESIPPGGESTGTIVFGRRPAPGTTVATLSFAHVFGFNPPSITVSGIQLSTSE